MFIGCDEQLDKEPLDQISDVVVWESEELMELYVVDLYSRVPYKTIFSNDWKYADIATKPDGNRNKITLGTMDEYNEESGLWNYGFVRDCNIFLERAIDAPIDETGKNILMSEVRFMRAVYYFQAAKRYGGIPLVTTVLDPFVSEEENWIPRNTEDEVYQFLITEFDEISELLPQNATSKSKYNKWMAIALKARVSLWAASIAKYGEMQLDGLVGVPSNKSTHYYQGALEAATLVINSGNYSLYNKFVDKSKNYSQIFVDEGNSEVILEKVYDGINVAHNWDNSYMPPSYSSTYGGMCNPLWEFVLSFENIDGSDSQPEIGIDHLYANGADLFENKDPRLKGTVLYQGISWGGDIVQTYVAVDPNDTPNPGQLLFTLGESYNGVPQVGKDSRRGTSNADRNGVTGFYVKKYLDESNLYPLPNASQTNWIMIRLAELYLIASEAAFEMNNIDQSLNYINPVRERAGISLLSGSTISLAKIRNERKVELAFEGFRYWDMRRWRISETEQVNNDEKFHGIDPVFHYKTGKYYFLPIEAENFNRVFRQEHYYNPITRSRINNNPALVENPLY